MILKKIAIAISKANKDVLEEEKIELKDIDQLVADIEEGFFNMHEISIEEIQDMVEKKLMEYGNTDLQKNMCCFVKKELC